MNNKIEPKKQVQNMKILYDHQIFGLQRVGGVSRYFHEIIKRVNSNPNTRGITTLRYTNNQYMLQYSKEKNNRIKKIITCEDLFWEFDFICKPLLFKLISRIIPDFYKYKHNMKSSLDSLIGQNFDILHPTYYNPYFLDAIGSKPFVVTVYDLIHELYPDGYSSKDMTRKWKALLLTKASRIIAISENTKNDIIKIYGINESLIDVIHLATSINEVVPCKPKKYIPERYILFVGERTRYKNFMLFMKAMKPIIDDDLQLHIICTGSEFTHLEQQSLNELGASINVMHVFCNDSELKYLYKNAIAFVFPSLYEGFGIPILEAFSSGCAAVISNGSSMREIGKDAVYYFDPTVQESITSAIKDVIYNNGIRDTLINRGHKMLSNFSWNKTASYTIKTYEKVLNIESNGKGNYL